MEIDFDYRKEESRILGEIMRPVARVILAYHQKKLVEYLYVDSGADVSLIPKSVGDWLGFIIEKEDKLTEIKGTGERGVPIIIKNIHMQIGEKQFETRVAWALIEDVPMLLGREDVFPLFDVYFKKNRKTLFRNGVGK